MACQRRYLARIAAELGEDPQPWERAARRSLAALHQQCYDDQDGLFYDRDAHGALVRVQSDVLLRVLACEVGDGDFFATALRRYLLNTRKFLARYPFTSLALDDPRFDHDAGRNSWGGPTNVLSLLRAPQAFEHHGRFVELTWMLVPALAAAARLERFPQTLDPWTGAAGYTERYSPAMLFVIDAVERLSGVLPRPDGEIWCTARLPLALDHGPVADAIAYARPAFGAWYEFVNLRGGATLYRDGVELARFPYGWRLVLDGSGAVQAVVGLAPRPVAGALVVGGRTTELTLAPNEVVRLDGEGRIAERGGPGLTPPTYA